ncbi:hypothetical protein LIER_39478 [Lithospermum erythrorhizon]|uniref:Uncharacterized protein n=1 Tax=Lithospermum erythrorhizon TaxID=34254 RepID=A0AAV3QIK6_LITER
MKGGEDDLMFAYSDVLNREMKDSTLGGSIVRANENPLNKDESLLDSFSSQQRLLGPASNLVGLMSLQLPPVSSKGK